MCPVRQDRFVRLAIRVTTIAVHNRIVDTRRQIAAAATATVAATTNRPGLMVLMIVVAATSRLALMDRMIAAISRPDLTDLMIVVVSPLGRMDPMVDRVSALIQVRLGIALLRAETLDTTARVLPATVAAVIRRRVRVADHLRIRMAEDMAADVNNFAENKNAAFRGGVSFCSLPILRDLFPWVVGSLSSSLLRL